MRIALNATITLAMQQHIALSFMTHAEEFHNGTLSYMIAPTQHSRRLQVGSCKLAYDGMQSIFEISQQRCSGQDKHGSTMMQLLEDSVIMDTTHWHQAPFQEL